MGPEQGRIGLLGGTFDPPHEGHLWMAERARRGLALAEVLLLPAYHPPHKDPAEISPYPLRLEMLRLLCAGRRHLRIDEAERESGGAGYTVDLVRFLQAREPDRRFVLIIGEDSLAEIETWKDPDALFALIEVAVLARAGVRTASRRPCILLAGETHPAQSRLIRQAIAAGAKPRWLPPALAAFIAEKGLYRRAEDRA